MAPSSSSGSSSSSSSSNWMPNMSLMRKLDEEVEEDGTTVAEDEDVDGV